MGREFGKLLASTREIAGANAIAEKAVIANADEAIRKDVEQEPAKELTGIELEDLSTVVVAIVLVGKTDGVSIESQQSLFGDGDAVGVSGQIGQHLGRPAERRLGVDNPVGGACLHEQSGPIKMGSPLAKGGAVVESLAEQIEKAVPEVRGQNFHGKEKLLSGHLSKATVLDREAGAGDDTMKVRMKWESLPPGVEDGEKAEGQAEMAGITADGQQGLTGGAE